jgi:hypothetical protein
MTFLVEHLVAEAVLVVLAQQEPELIQLVEMAGLVCHHQ